MIFVTLIDGSIFEISKKDIETVLYNAAPFIPSRCDDEHAVVRTCQIIAISAGGDADITEFDKIIESYNDEPEGPFYPQL